MTDGHGNVANRHCYDKRLRQKYPQRPLSPPLSVAAEIGDILCSYRPIAATAACASSSRQPIRRELPSTWYLGHDDTRLVTPPPPGLSTWSSPVASRDAAPQCQGAAALRSRAMGNAVQGHTSPTKSSSWSREDGGGGGDDEDAATIKRGHSRECDLRSARGLAFPKAPPSHPINHRPSPTQTVCSWQPRPARANVSLRSPRRQHRSVS